MISSFSRKLSDTYRKNKDEVLALLFHSLPDFVYKKLDYLPENMIPVFCFHSVEAKRLEEQFKYLFENDYKTLDANSLVDILLGKKIADRNTIALTFDDGRKSFWTTAFPLLKKYGLTAISFIIPSIVKNETVKSFTLEDVWSNKISKDDLEKIELKNSFCNWNEIHEMHASNLVDFQSHSLHHASVFTDKTLIDFINPDLTPSLLNGTLNPIVYVNGKDVLLGANNFGYPVYRWESNLTAAKRFVNNEKLSLACVDYVKSHGDEVFFKNPKWRKELKTYYTKIKTEFGAGTFQTYEKRKLDISEDLIKSKTIIENNLNKPVKHLCLPWYKGNKLTVELSKETGYSGIYWGIVNMHSINYRGSDPFYINRINDHYIFSLPGKNRISLKEQIINQKLKKEIAKLDSVTLKFRQS